MKSPLVSVMIPVYNAGQYLRPALESILHQTYGALEILVIDDGSTDGCLQSIADIRDSRITMLGQSNAGKSVALNRGLERVHGEFYLIQDADDLSYPNRIEEQVIYLIEHPDVAAIFTGYDYIVAGCRLAPRFRGKNAEECQRDIESMRMPCLDPTAMFRMSMVRGILYEPQLRIGQGMDYILRVGEQYPMAVLGECLYSYRANPKSTTRQNAIRRREMVCAVLRRAHERRGLPMEGVLRHTAGAAWTVHGDAEHGFVPHCMESVLDLRRCHRGREALRTAWACARLHPLDPYYYKPFAYLFAPLTSVSWYRAVKRRFAKVGRTTEMDRGPRREAETA
jgi:glycosyltransferase involved in cell wall biosynthesis